MHLNGIEFVGTPVIRRCVSVIFTFHRQYRKAKMAKCASQLQHLILLVCFRKRNFPLDSLELHVQTTVFLVVVNIYYFSVLKIFYPEKNTVLIIIIEVL